MAVTQREGVWEMRNMLRDKPFVRAVSTYRRYIRHKM